MDIVFDTTWCPVCSRQILPKHIRVSTKPVEALVTPVPPLSPTTQAKTDASHMHITCTKGGTIHAHGDGRPLHSTGRAKSNSTIKRLPKDAQTATAVKKLTPTAPNATTLAAPVQHRTVIDQSPVPLYCSDECRLADLQNSQGIDIRYNPEQYVSSLLPPVPPNSATRVNLTEESDLSPGSSLESTNSSLPSPISYNVSLSPISSTSSATEKTFQAASYPIPKAYAALASIYSDLPPCPPPPPLWRTNTSSSSKPKRCDHNYDSGVIMAARCINEALHAKPEPKKRPSWSTPSSVPSTAYALNASAGRTIIPEWTDGSNKWRASIYSFATPSKGDDKSGIQEERLLQAYTYKGYVSTPLRSMGVYSTLSEQSTPTPSANAPAYNPGLQIAHARSEAEELYNKFDFLFTRRSKTRSSLAYQQLSTSPTGSTCSLPVTAGIYRCKEVSILKKGAEGKLLVPDVKMKRVDSSSATSSCSSSYTGITASGSVYGSRRWSLLSCQGSEISTADLYDTARLSVEPKGQSWSYKDSLYPIMQLTTKEKRIERHLIDGEERDIEVEVEVKVILERKRLFLFSGKSSRH